MVAQACRGSFENWNNDNENIIKIQHVEDISRYTDNLEEITDYNLYALTREMIYDTEIATDINRKVITICRKNRPVKDFISIPEEGVDKVIAEEKRKFIDLAEKDSEVEVPNNIGQENSNDALNSDDNGCD
jgi:hypothetical protein